MGTLEHAFCLNEPSFWDFWQYISNSERSWVRWSGHALTALMQMAVLQSLLALRHLTQRPSWGGQEHSCLWQLAFGLECGHLGFFRTFVRPDCGHALNLECNFLAWPVFDLERSSHLGSYEPAVRLGYGLALDLGGRCLRVEESDHVHLRLRLVWWAVL